MAIYRCEIKPVSRKDGRNAILAACYRAGVALVDECDFFTKARRRHDYTRRGGVITSGLVLPVDAPASLQDRQGLWNAQERAENRKNSRIAREAVIALPHELTDIQRQRAVIRYATHIMQRYGVGCDYAIHRPHRRGDSRNHHAHILFTTRRITPDGLGGKTRELDDKTTGAEEIIQLRQTWEHICNDMLAEARQAARVDCRSLQAQGVHRIPQPKQGAIATAMERAGQCSHAGEERRAVTAYNDVIAMMEQERDSDAPEPLPTPSRAITDATNAVRHARQHNDHPVHWLYRRIGYYLRKMTGRARQGHQSCRLRHVWREVRIRQILDNIARYERTCSTDEPDTEPIAVASPS